MSRHAATLKYVAQALAVANLSSRQVLAPSLLPRTARGEFELVILDLDVDPATAPTELCAQVAAASADTPIVTLAGLDTRKRLVQSLAHAGVVGCVPKLGGWVESLTSEHTEAKPLEGPDEQELGVALRRRIERATQPVGPQPYLLAGAAIDERLVGGSAAKDAVLAELLAEAARFGLSDEKVRRIETAADELMLNAIYDAPPPASTATIDRGAPVVLAAQAQVRVRWGCDGARFVVSVLDRFGRLARAAVAAHLQHVLDARSSSAGAAGLGLVLTYSAANLLAIQVLAGRFTEVTAVLHVAGSNRAAVARGSSLHIYDQT